MEGTHENGGAPVLAATLVQCAPPSVVTWTLPSSVPAQITLALRGLSEMAVMVQWNSARVLSSEISPPESLIFSGSLVVRSGLMTFQVSPPSAERKSTLPPL